jgi:hypothetical protein
MITNAAALEKPLAGFDIEKLARQIDGECVWPTSQNDDPKWGRANEQERSYCVSLLTRIEDMLASPEMACVFRTGEKPSFSRILDEFLEDADATVLRVSLKQLPFAHNSREIVANAIGRHVLSIARQGRFRNRPILVFLDEAHQFLDRTLGDENTRYPLDSFELIAKEGRKSSLNICISTQRPRDIPDGVLSQMGTLIVHRLINDKDREVVERASGEIDRSAAAFLPTLAPGQAVIIGVDFPIPLTIQISPPSQQPDSRGPDYQAFWQVPAQHDQAQPKTEDEVASDTQS